MNIKEIQDSFEDETVGGYPVKFLTIMGEVLMCAVNDMGWLALNFSLDGKCTDIDDYDLVPKNKHLPKDVLCQVWSHEDDKLSCGPMYSTGTGKFFAKGKDSFSATDADFTISFKHFKVILNPVRPWFGGGCPIPEGCEYRVYAYEGWCSGSLNIGWGENEGITAYQILGTKE